MKSLLRHLRVLFTVCILLLLSGCNHDVFVDASEMIGDISVTIDGDGGEAKIEIPLKGLEFFSIDEYYNSPYITYYDSDGVVIRYDSPASDIASIVYDNDFSKFEVGKSGSTVIIKSVSNALGQRIFPIRLEYDYGIRYINVVISSGRQMELIDVNYFTDLEIDDNDRVVTSHSGYVNNGPVAQPFLLMPYVNAMASILVEPDDAESWVRALDLDLPVPVYEDGVWVIRKHPGIRPGINYTYHRPDYKDTVKIDVPAWSKVVVYNDVTFSHADCKGEMIFINPVLERRLSVCFTATSNYPVNYELRVENAE